MSTITTVVYTNAFEAGKYTFPDEETEQKVLNGVTTIAVMLRNFGATDMTSTIKTATTLFSVTVLRV
jgi:hypothetical protein